MIAWGGMVDPTKPSGVSIAPSTQSGGGLILQSTLVSGSQKTAVINGRRYHEGDRVGKAVVREIRSFGVKLEKNGKTVHLPLVRARIKGSQTKATENVKK